jgi:hypothetical protein
LRTVNDTAMMLHAAALALLALAHAANIAFHSSAEMHGGAWETHGATAVPPGHHAVQGHGPHAPAAVFGGAVPMAAGAAWARAPNAAAEWVLTAKFRIDGAAGAGGNGLGLWYTAQPGRGTGPVMGAPDRWTGLGVLIDTYDDDHDGSNPAIMGIMNDGRESYNAARDGEGQYFAGCLRPLRNQEHPVAARLSYRRGDGGHGVLKMELGDAPVGGGEPQWATCFEHEGVHLPPGYYFGVSGSTNDHPDAIAVYDVAVETTGAGALYDAAKDLHGGAYVEKGHHEVHNAHSKHLHELREHVGELTRHMEHVAGSVGDAHDAAEQAAHELREDLHGLRTELHAHMQRIQEHFASHHSASVHAAHESLHAGGAAGAKFYLALVGTQVVVLALFLLVKSRMDKAAEHARKWA